MSLKAGKQNAYGDEVLDYACFEGICDDAIESALKAKAASAQRGVWLDLAGADECKLLLPAAMNAGWQIHSGSKDKVTLRVWGSTRTDSDPCPERAFTIHIVHCLVVRDDASVLLVKQSYDAKQLFTLPGGFIDATETVDEAGIRETFEETGVNAHPVALLSTYHAPSFEHGTRFGHAGLEQTPLMRASVSDAVLGETNTAEEISAVEWVPASQWGDPEWLRGHCGHLVQFSLQQLAEFPSKHGPKWLADDTPPVVCVEAAAALQQARAAVHSRCAVLAAEASTDAHSAHPNMHACSGMAVQWHSGGNDGAAQIFTSDLTGPAGVRAWW
jgi:ADP-ribose pyrophosphatase YjhB (NUDIX family)